MDEKFDPEVIDLRNIQPATEPEPSSAAEAVNVSRFNFKAKAMSIKQMCLVMGITCVVLAVFLFLVAWLGRPAANIQVYRPTCPDGQPLPHGQLCTEATSATN